MAIATKTGRTQRGNSASSGPRVSTGIADDTTKATKRSGCRQYNVKVRAALPPYIRSQISMLHAAAILEVDKESRSTSFPPGREAKGLK